MNNSHFLHVQRRLTRRIKHLQHRIRKLTRLLRVHVKQVVFTFTGLPGDDTASLVYSANSASHTYTITKNGSIKISVGSETTADWYITMANSSYACTPSSGILVLHGVKKTKTVHITVAKSASSFNKAFAAKDFH